jgi:hypothetical protein
MKHHLLDFGIAPRLPDMPAFIGIVLLAPQSKIAMAVLLQVETEK